MFLHQLTITHLLSRQVVPKYLELNFENDSEKEKHVVQDPLVEFLGGW